MMDRLPHPVRTILKNIWVIVVAYLASTGAMALYQGSVTAPPWLLVATFFAVSAINILVAIIPARQRTD